MPTKWTALTPSSKACDKPGRHAVGGGLHLLTRHGKPGADGAPTIRKSWLLRYMLNGFRRDLGLGAYPTVTLAEARRKAEDARRLIADGIDPVDAAKAAAAAAARGPVPTFAEAAEQYIASHRDGWRNPKHRQQWQNTLATYAHPVIGEMSVADVAVGDVLRVLEPVWKAKPETATRLRGRIEAVIDWAIAREYRSGDNPARWRGRLQQLLPAKAKIRRVEHHPALDWRMIGAFMQDLRARPAPAARALEFAILTAARGGEVRGATWSEVDIAGAVWNVPGERMKAGRDHRVPLSDAAQSVLKSALAQHVELTGKPPAPDALIFEGGRRGRPLSENAFMMLLARMDRADITSHGFRSTFRDWAAEATAYPREVCESALAHVNKDRVEAAYLRGDHFDQRRRLMTDWARFCSQPATATAANVVPIRTG